MSAETISQGRRSLAQIEADLRESEQAFADAESRMADAQRDRRAALEAINKSQAEFDEAVAKLRQGSAPGSKWRTELEGPDAPLILKFENMADDAPPQNRSDSASTVAAEFERLRSCVRTGSGSSE